MPIPQLFLPQKISYDALFKLSRARATTAVFSVNNHETIPDVAFFECCGGAFFLKMNKALCFINKLMMVVYYYS